eukprot:8722194-Pyramimonas_sp.AAC.1
MASRWIAFVTLSQPQGEARPGSDGGVQNQKALAGSLEGMRALSHTTHRLNEPKGNVVHHGAVLVVSLTSLSCC